jgi:hypothetical protein
MVFGGIQLTETWGLPLTSISGFIDRQIPGPGRIHATTRTRELSEPGSMTQRSRIDPAGSSGPRFQPDTRELLITHVDSTPHSQHGTRGPGTPISRRDVWDQRRYRLQGLPDPIGPEF